MEFKQEAVRRMAEATTIVGLAEELGVRRKLLYQWRDQVAGRRQSGAGTTPGPAAGQQVTERFLRQRPSAAEVRIAELERLLGRKQLEVDFLKRAFEQVRGAASSRTSDGGKESIAGIEASLSFEGVGLTVEQQCQVAEVSRAGFYRSLRAELSPNRQTCCCALGCRS